MGKIEGSELERHLEVLAYRDKRIATLERELSIHKERAQQLEREKARWIKWPQRQQLQAEVERLGRLARDIACVWCGHHFASTIRSQADHLYEHAKTCERHPVYTIQQKVKRLTKALEAVGQDRDRLRKGMKTAKRLAVQIAEESMWCETGEALAAERRCRGCDGLISPTDELCTECAGISRMADRQAERTTETEG